MSAQPPPGRLRDVYLDQVSFRRNRDFAFTGQQIDYQVDVQTAAEIISNREQALVRLSAEVKWQAGPPFEMELTVAGLFDWDDPNRPDEDIEGWLEFNAVHLLWPYLRMYINIISSASGLPPLTIYTITAPHPVLGRVGEDAAPMVVPPASLPPGATPHG